MTSLIRVLMFLEAITFCVGAVLHLGIPLFGVIEPPRIVPATIVEALCGGALGATALSYARPRWGARAALIAHAFAIGGVLLGMGALAAGRGPSMPLNTMYHRVILVALVGTGALVVTAGRERHETA